MGQYWIYLFWNLFVYQLRKHKRKIEKPYMFYKLKKRKKSPHSTLSNKKNKIRDRWQKRIKIIHHRHYGDAQLLINIHSKWDNYCFVCISSAIKWNSFRFWSYVDASERTEKNMSSEGITYKTHSFSSSASFFSFLKIIQQRLKNTYWIRFVWFYVKWVKTLKRQILF